MAKVKVANNPTQEEAASNLIRGENYNAIAEKLKLDINLEELDANACAIERNVYAAHFGLVFDLNARQFNGGGHGANAHAQGYGTNQQFLCEAHARFLK